MRKPCSRGPDGRIVHEPLFAYPAEVRQAIETHYSAYYTHFGIRNVRDHVAKRLREEFVESDRLALHELLLNRKFENARALVVGLGTGGLAVALHSLGNEVHGVEPDAAALRIAQQKLAYVGREKSHFLGAVAEHLPYRSNAFDFVFCFTVLEHVQDVKTSLHEMVRVLKPGGTLILNTPEYRFPFEAHYKVPVLLKPLPRFLSAAILKIAGKPPGPLFSEITYVTSKQVQHLLMEMPNLVFFRVLASYPDDWRTRARSLRDRFIYACFRFWSRHLEIYRNQEYYVFKLPG